MIPVAPGKNVANKLVQLGLSASSVGVGAGTVAANAVPLGFLDIATRARPSIKSTASQKRVQREFQMPVIPVVTIASLLF
jgi:hypothetical protein